MKRSALPALLLLAPLAACHRDKEVVVVTPGPTHTSYVGESEPNDAALQANYLGVLRPGERVVIDGAISSMLTDLYDGFAFVSSVPLRVEFALLADGAADLDLCVYDPLIGDFSLCFENEGDEIDAFEVIFGNAEFHLVVTPFDLPGGYTLEVNAYPLFLPAGLPSGPSTEGAGALRAADGAATSTEPRSAGGYREGGDAGAPAEVRES